ncbi:variant erythrocyte surface antigen-1 family protein [Babesia caballi]|uniref:Variant erythrocyte surface antigen-1 family protein n=1 Tax=Babesia caballi TaxID=5871 RepID=A0AAV4M174_BABCB|nr:variant erythrocyte surface antigen-1 family protein [Babesia caballi]
MGNGTDFGAEIGKVTQVLGGSGDGRITKLANGLQQFIGYNGQHGRIGTGGIAVSNLPVERLRDAVLMFIGPFLGVLRRFHPELENYSTHLISAVEACKNGVGCGKDGFQKELAEVETALGQVSGSNSGINAVLNKVKEVSKLKGQTQVREFATHVKDYFNGVLGKVENDSSVTTAGNSLNTKVQNLKTNLQTLVDNVGNQLDAYPINVGEGPDKNSQKGLKKDIDTIYAGGTGALTHLRSAFSKLTSGNQKPAYALSAATHTATTAFVTVLQTDYTSYYKGVMWTSDSDNPQKCAKIFIACLPLIFNGLSYFYWKCSDQNGWKDMTLGSPEPKAFMGLTSIGANRVKSGRKGSDVVTQAFGNFQEFKTASNASTTSYANFFKKFKGNCLTTWKTPHTATDNTFLSGLYLCSTSYFRHQHQKKAAQARPPSSIREMLYWLMGLTATPQFGDLLGHIDKIVGSDFKVAVSGSTKQNETLSADKVTSYIISTCYTSPSVLDIIQGSVPPKESQNDPWLHRLYSNSEFNFRYPSSGAALFYALSDYTYALQFQLGFLYQQCSQLYVNTCGWFMCNYGQGVNKSFEKKIVPSHICPVGCSNHGNSDDINKHKTYCEHTGCGENTNASPLQAFLTDQLTGFSRGHPSSHSRHLSDCSGYTCHVPMGFESHLRADGKYQGGHISPTLKGFCGSSNTPLCQLTETLTCLTKRTPRSLGDIFGFIWHLNGQLFKTRPTLKDLAKKLVDAIGTPNNSKVPAFIVDLLEKIGRASSGGPSTPSGLSRSLEAMAPTLPFLYQLFMAQETDFLPTKIYDLNGSAHRNSHKDLYSISACRNGPNDPCGQYLSPLCYSTGATFAPKHASSYLSWVLYLTDDMQSRFHELLNEFKNIDCSKSGCGGKPECSEHHASGTHGNPSCQCPSVVQCGGVLPLLYRQGFRFNNALHLKNGSNKQGHHKRTCEQFHSQLQNVINGDPLHRLLVAVDSLLYAIRWEFFSKLSTFWAIYLTLILYTFFFLLDTLRVRSHLKLTSSHMVPPLALLTTGKALPVTKLTYIGQ